MLCFDWKYFNERQNMNVFLSEKIDLSLSFRIIREKKLIDLKLSPVILKFHFEVLTKIEYSGWLKLL